MKKKMIAGFAVVAVIITGFICLTVMPIRGVLEWKEVQYDELPAAVKSNYAAPAEI